MTRNEQMEFITSLTDSIRRELHQQIKTGKIPAHWDGFELRQHLADKFNREVCTMNRKRKADYRNTVIVNNL